MQSLRFSQKNFECPKEVQPLADAIKRGLVQVEKLMASITFSSSIQNSARILLVR